MLVCLRLCCLQAHSIAGTHVRAIALSVSALVNCGSAISPDGAHMVTSHDNHTLSVHSLSGGEHIRTFGCRGAGEGQFDRPGKMCFSADGNILVAEQLNKRVQQVTLTGDHVRFIGVGVIDDSVWGIAANAELIVTGKYDGTSNKRIMMFDAVTGALVRAFGDYGDAPGRLMKYCNGIRFTPDNRHIIVAECEDFKFMSAKGRLSVFTLAGEFVRCIGDGKLKVAGDAEVADNGDVIVCDFFSNRILVFSADDNTLVRQWEGGDNNSNGPLVRPTALAMCGGQLYVVNQFAKHVQVFE